MQHRRHVNDSGVHRHGQADTTEDQQPEGQDHHAAGWSFPGRA
jgi:hypothetical protein